MPSSKKPVTFKRVEGRQQTGMREEEEGLQQPVRRLLVGGWRAAGGRQKQTGGQPSEAAAGERGGAQGLERARGASTSSRGCESFSLGAVHILQVGISDPVYNWQGSAQQQICYIIRCTLSTHLK